MFMLWYGGTNYSVPYVEDAEIAPSIDFAIDVCDSRLNNDLGDTPNVTDESEAHYFSYDPRHVDDPYPDFVIKIVDGEWVSEKV